MHVFSHCTISKPQQPLISLAGVVPKGVPTGGGTSETGQAACCHPTQTGSWQHHSRQWYWYSIVWPGYSNHFLPLMAWQVMLQLVMPNLLKASQLSSQGSSYLCTSFAIHSLCRCCGNTTAKDSGRHGWNHV